MKRQPAADRFRADLLVNRGARAYVVEVKSASEGRRDRLVPLLAQAILQARAFAKSSSQPAAPLAIVGAPRVGDALAKDLEQFTEDYAPGAAVGVVDLEGFRWFRGAGLESLSAPRGARERKLRSAAPDAGRPHLFSDLNQWMLKILLAPRIPVDMLNAPRAEVRNASHLAAVASVSMMSAFRLVRRLQVEGFVDESSAALRLVRLDALLERWRAESLRPAREVPLRWILRGDRERQLYDALRAQVAAPPRSTSRANAAPSRVCLAVFAAADALGLGVVHGVAPHIYLDRLESRALGQLGLSLEPPGAAPDVYVRVPVARESVFRGAVLHDGLPVSDVVQVWLDASAHLSRGAEQADLIYRRVLRPLIDRRSR